MVLSRSLLQALIEKWQIKFHFYILLRSEDKLVASLNMRDFCNIE